MAYSSKNARAGVILLLGTHLCACEPDLVELSSIPFARVDVPAAPSREDVARVFVVEAKPKPRRKESVRTKPETPVEALPPPVEPPAEYAAPPAPELALSSVWAIPGAMPSQDAPEPAPTRVAARRYEPQSLFGVDVRVEHPRREWPFLPRPEGPRTARLTEVDIPMEVNIPLPRFRGPMIDIVEFDASGQHRPRITFRVHQESGTGAVERQGSSEAPK
jgi:hypothetical protein